MCYFSVKYIPISSSFISVHTDVFTHCFTDTTAKLVATKAVAGDANTTAMDVLERLGNLNLQLHGLQQNYSELEDTVNTANQMIQDPEKNSEFLTKLCHANIR